MAVSGQTSHSVQLYDAGECGQAPLLFAGYVVVWRSVLVFLGSDVWISLQQWHTTAVCQHVLNARRPYTKDKRPLFDLAVADVCVCYAIALNLVVCSCGACLKSSHLCGPPSGMFFSRCCSSEIYEFSHIGHKLLIPYGSNSICGYVLDAVQLYRLQSVSAHFEELPC